MSSEHGGLFGTDGIRGRAGERPLDAPTLHSVGRAIARVLAEDLGRSPRIVLGRDTRESGPVVAAALGAGLNAAGATLRSAGIVPSPAVSFLARTEAFDAGVVISASHNPHPDNGIKLFDSSGTKLSEALEVRVERTVAELAVGGKASDRGGRCEDEADLAAGYLSWLTTRGRDLELDLGARRVVLDCAHGAASEMAPALFRALGADPDVIHATPNGRNINSSCGAVHPDSLRDRVLTTRADLGIAFDGDADRAIFVDGRGREVDGDHVLLITADRLQRQGRLRGGAIVGTVMSNYGLEQALASRGLSLLRTRVGDRFILEQMRATGCNLGGEPSGHVIFLDDAPTGDGMLTALQVLAAMASAGRTLASLSDDLPRTPQAQRNVPVREKIPLDEVDGFAELLDEWTRQLAGEGRIVVRYSGTEMAARVMVEGRDAGMVESCAEALAGHVRRQLA